ncbi:hypothetical protein [Desulfosporosinus sp. BICA1-9]|uniref:hypothetical protein n=1 Tax=Desulfosporosinus sp. BICA1-9 TaxID=1531958 RepID=UPI000A5A46E0|nr:hypothetical protein [Desulfosporosinus sp. BICA1-9]
MPNLTTICYLSSLLFYGMGYSKTLVIKNAVAEHLNTYDYTIYVSLATGYFVLAIFCAIIGSFFFYIKNNRNQEIIHIKNLEFRVKAGGGLVNRRRASISEVKAQLRQAEYGLNLERRMSS